MTARLYKPENLTEKRAIRILISFYKGELSFEDLQRYTACCPLCELFFFSNCDACPWVKHMHRRCYDYTPMKKYYTKRTRRYPVSGYALGLLKYYRPKRWCKDSIKRLEGWLKLAEN